MNLLIATGLIAPEIGGPATYTAFLQAHLPRFQVAFTVIPFRKVRKLPKLVRHVAYFFLLIYQGRTADIVYALDTVSVGVPAALASAILHKRFFLRVPGDYAWEQGQQRYGLRSTLDEYLTHQRTAPFPVRALAFLQRAVARRAERVIVPSDYMRSVVTRWGIDPAKVYRVYSGLKMIAVPDAKEALRKELGYQGFVVVTAARLVPWKGVRALIDAIVSLRHDGHEVSLRVIGEGTEYPSLCAHTESQGASSYVSFLGALPREVLGKHLKAADAFVLNTSYEGLSHQLIEVMSLGTPIVTTPVGGNTELIEDGKSGVLVQYNDVVALKATILRLMTDGAWGTMLAKNALRRVDIFREDVVIEEFIKLIQ